MIRPNRLHTLVAVAATLAMAGAAPDPIMGPGISRELATERSANIGGVRYEVHLSVASPEVARGSIAIRFSAKKASDVVVDFRGPRLANIVVNDRTANTIFNGMHLRIPAEAIRAGENVVKADFA